MAEINPLNNPQEGGVVDPTGLQNNPQQLLPGEDVLSEETRADSGTEIENRFMYTRDTDELRVVKDRGFFGITLPVHAVLNPETAFFGDGSDGELVATSGTTTLNTSGKNVYQYTNFSLTGTASLAIGSNLQNKPIFIFVSGDMTVTSSTNPAVTGKGRGGQGGTGAVAGGGNTITTPATDGTIGADCWNFNNKGGAGGSSGSADSTGGGGGGGGGLNVAGTNGTNGTATGGAGGTLHFYQTSWTNNLHIAYSFIGGGGGGGGGGRDSGGGSTSGGAGGAGGTSIIFLVKGNVTISSTFNCAGDDGVAGANGGASQRGGSGGGGGAGGFIGIFYGGAVISNTATFTVSGGAGGAGGTGPDGDGKAGGAGGAGEHVVSLYKGV